VPVIHNQVNGRGRLAEAWASGPEWQGRAGRARAEKGTTPTSERGQHFLALCGQQQLKNGRQVSTEARMICRVAVLCCVVFCLFWLVFWTCRRTVPSAVEFTRFWASSSSGHVPAREYQIMAVHFVMDVLYSTTGLV
jgi:hypothetical protein